MNQDKFFTYFSGGIFPWLCSWYDLYFWRRTSYHRFFGIEPNWSVFVFGRKTDYFIFSCKNQNFDVR